MLKGFTYIYIYNVIVHLLATYFHMYPSTTFELLYNNKAILFSNKLQLTFVQVKKFLNFPPNA